MAGGALQSLSELSGAASYAVYYFGASKNPFGLGSGARNRGETPTGRGRAETARGRNEGKGKTSPNGKPNLTKGKKAEEDAAPVPKVQAPRVGAKPVRKKGGSARRPSSG